MPTLPTDIYIEDLTGTNETNKYVEEITITSTYKKRSICPSNNGLFFKDKVRLFDKLRNCSLVEKIDYIVLDIHALLTIKTGKEIASTVLIINQEVSEVVILEVQLVGGKYFNSINPIKALIDNIANDNRTVSLDNVIGKPLDFNASPHLHGIDDPIKFEYLLVSLEELRSAILMGDQIKYNNVLEYIASNMTYISGSVDSLLLGVVNRLTGDIADAVSKRNEVSVNLSNSAQLYSSLDNRITTLFGIVNTIMANYNNTETNANNILSKL